MFTISFAKDGCIYSRDNDPGEEYCFTVVDIELAADVECDADTIIKHDLENERMELINKFHSIVREKELMVKSFASAEEAYTELEIARQKILSLMKAERLKKLRFVVQTCLEIGNIIEQIEERLQDSEFKDIILLARNIR